MAQGKCAETPLNGGCGVEVYIISGKLDKTTRMNEVNDYCVERVATYFSANGTRKNVQETPLNGGCGEEVYIYVCQDSWTKPRR